MFFSGVKRSCTDPFFQPFPQKVKCPPPSPRLFKWMLGPLVRKPSWTSIHFVINFCTFAVIRAQKFEFWRFLPSFLLRSVWYPWTRHFVQLVLQRDTIFHLFLNETLIQLVLERYTLFNLFLNETLCSTCSWTRHFVQLVLERDTPFNLFLNETLRSTCSWTRHSVQLVLERDTPFNLLLNETLCSTCSWTRHSVQLVIERDTLLNLFLNEILCSTCSWTRNCLTCSWTRHSVQLVPVDSVVKPCTSLCWGLTYDKLVSCPGGATDSHPLNTTETGNKRPPYHYSFGSWENAKF